MVNRRTASKRQHRWRRGEIMQKISFANIECDLDIYILECNSGISVKRCWPNKLIAAWISKAISAFYCFSFHPLQILYTWLIYAVVLHYFFIFASARLFVDLAKLTFLSWILKGHLCFCQPFLLHLICTP